MIDYTFTLTLNTNYINNSMKYLLDTNSPRCNPHDDICVFFTGELYNLDYIKTQMSISHNYDIERVIAHLYSLYGFEYTLTLLDGVFAIILIDHNIYGQCTRLFISRDAMGIYPLLQKGIQYTNIPGNNLLSDSDELLVPFIGIDNSSIGVYHEYERSSRVSSSWKLIGIKRWYIQPLSRMICTDEMESYLTPIVRKYLEPGQTYGCLLTTNQMGSMKLAESVIKVLRVADIHEMATICPSIVCETYRDIEESIGSTHYVMPDFWVNTHVQMAKWICENTTCKIIISDFGLVTEESGNQIDDEYHRRKMVVEMGVDTIMSAFRENGLIIKFPWLDTRLL